MAGRPTPSADSAGRRLVAWVPGPQLVPQGDGASCRGPRGEDQRVGARAARCAPSGCYHVERRRTVVEADPDAPWEAPVYQNQTFDVSQILQGCSARGPSRCRGIAVAAALLPRPVRGRRLGAVAPLSLRRLLPVVRRCCIRCCSWLLAVWHPARDVPDRRRVVQRDDDGLSLPDRELVRVRKRPAQPSLHCRLHRVQPRRVRRRLGAVCGLCGHCPLRSQAQGLGAVHFHVVCGDGEACARRAACRCRHELKFSPQ